MPSQGSVVGHPLEQAADIASELSKTTTARGETTIIREQLLRHQRPLGNRHGWGFSLLFVIMEL